MAGHPLFIIWEKGFALWREYPKMIEPKHSGDHVLGGGTRDHQASEQQQSSLWLVALRKLSVNSAQTVDIGCDSLSGLGPIPLFRQTVG